MLFVKKPWSIIRIGGAMRKNSRRLMRPTKRLGMRRPARSMISTDPALSKCGGKDIKARGLIRVRWVLILGIFRIYLEDSAIFLDSAEVGAVGRGKRADAILKWKLQFPLRKRC